MDDNIRTHIMNYLESHIDENFKISKLEEMAEGLNKYLNFRGYTIIDKYYYQNKLKHMIGELNK